MQDKINWQVSSTFSEDGKRSDIVNYFDGTFRSRQTVTGVNLEKQELISIPFSSNLSCLPGSDKIHEVIAGETIYDFQGRPTVNILPTPTNSFKIEYLPLLNRLENTNKSYNWQDFDKPGYNCLLSKKLDAGIYTNGIMGSSGYYSPNNPNKLGFNAFIPDAGGYPFTQVSYLQDNTSRISTQSGVGKTFKLGNGKETRYFYATPNAKELYKMFGTEVGDAIRYKKDAVIDPNGQVAVTYMNPEGKVIATCLAGDGPKNLEQLENQNKNTITVSLLDKNLINTDDKTIITEHSFFVGYPGKYTFDYSITPQTLDALLCDNAEVCLDCIYDIVITLNHNEKCTSTPLFEYSGTIGELIVDNTYPDLNCDNNSSTGNYPRQKIESLDIGTYVITKKITVNKQAALKYVEEVYKEKCESKWNEFLTDELSRIDTMDCYSSCLDCQQPPVPTQDCDTSYCKPNPNRCEVIRGMMLSDISPGGQYAQFDRDVSGNVNSIDPLSIFNPANILPYNDPPVYSYSLLSQYNITDYTSMVNNWLPEYAEVLLQLHPEACMLNWCTEPDITETLDFDVEILSAHNYSDAISKGYINPSSGDISLQLLDADPWFNQMNVYKNILKANLLQYGCDHKEEIEKLAMKMAYCAFNNPPPQDMQGTPQMNDPSLPICTLSVDYFTTHDFGSDNISPGQGNPSLADLEWTFLRALYLSAKNKVLQSSMDGYANNNQCDTRCIGSGKWWWLCLHGNYNLVNYNSPPCKEHWACFYYSDKQIRFGSETRSTFQAMDDAGISIDFSGINVNDPCQITEAIQNQSGSINQQFASIYCGDIISAPCEISNTLTLLINTMISQLKDSLSAYIWVTISGEQLPLSIRNAGIGAISVAIIEQRLMTITLRPCTDPIEIPFLQTETGLLRPVSVSISNIVCPNNANCRFNLKVTYANNLRTTKDFHIQTECDYLKDCVNSTSGICTQTTVHAKAVRDYLNSIFRFIIAYNTPPSSPQLLNLLPSILKEKNGKPALNISLNYSYDFIITISYGKGDSETDTCTIVLRSNSNITNWFDIKNIINITPDLASVQNNLTNSFNLNVISGNDIDNFSKYIINGIFSCWNMNQCPPEVNFCDTIPEFPSVPPINDCPNKLLYTAYGNTNIRYQQWIDSVKNDLLQRYYEKCLTAAEIFNMTYDDKQYHYTLYYYDQAGNLVKTVPPTGVKLLNDDQTQQIADDRETGNNITLLPEHIKPTLYRYNTLNQVTWQETPDAGQSNFYYDGLGRIVASQNAQQNQEGAYAYTKYDLQGRIVESGKVKTNNINSSKTRDFDKWQSFIESEPDRTEITLTRYDESLTPQINQKFGPSGQRNLRNRVSSVLKFRRGENLLNKKYTHATHYTYDIQGNVYKLIQDYPNDIIGDKTIEYRYDLQSGKVNEVIYQRGAPDQFMHKYNNDASNRLIRVETSLNGLIWETDAEYFYYRHGPLARMELGTDKVQGLDYMYTLQGWIKGVNGTTLSAETDMGQDGIINPPDETGQQKNVPGTITINGQTYNIYNLSQLVGNNFNGTGYGALHNPIARDAFGYVLDYFKKDYIPISGNSCLNALQQKVGSVNSLFNGNIARMYTQIQELGNTGFNYKYDQLNRLISQKGWKLENSNMQSIVDAYHIKLKYDADGNILTLRRNGTFDKPKMDNLHYNYYTQNGTIYNPEILIPPDATNRLAFVNDDIPDGEYTEDIDEQKPGNYNYNLIGNLISDNKGNIEHIHWNLQNKVIKIDKLNGPGIGFEYDALGNRIMKLVGGSEESITFYVRDAQGNILTTYSYKVHENEGNTPLLYWDEAHLYGSSRIGLYKPEMKIPKGKIGIDNDRRNPEEARIIMFNKNLFGNIIYNNNLQLSKKKYLSKRPTEPYYSEIRGYKQYELTNHLGNVLATITDRKLPVINNGTVESYTADISTSQDYYPFGMEMPGRKFNSSLYDFGFNGKLNDNEVYGDGNFQDYGFRMYDTRICRFIIIDPLNFEYPMLTPYQFASNTPIRAIDLDGTEGVDIFRFLINVFTGQGPTSDDPEDIEQYINERNLANGIVKKCEEINKRTEKAKRIGNDVVIIGGGVFTAYFSGGTVPVILALISATGGTLKLVADLNDDYESSDKIRTTLSGTVIVGINYFSGDKLISEEILFIAEYTEGVLTLKPSDPSKISLIKNIFQSRDIYNVISDVPEVMKNYKNLESTKSSSSSTSTSSSGTDLNINVPDLTTPQDNTSPSKVGYEEMPKK